MLIKAHRKEVGLSMLETAGVTLIGLTLIYVAVGIVSFYQIHSSVTSIVEREVFDNTLKPIKLRNGEVVFDESAMQSGLQDMLTRADANLRAQLKLPSDGDRLFRLEVQAARLEVDPQTGAVRSVNYPPQLKVSSGTLAIPPALDRKTDLRQSIDALVDQEATSKILVVPSGSFGISENGVQAFLPFSTVVALRLFYSFDHSLTADVVKMLGVADYPVAYDLSTVGVRGAVGN